MVFSELPWILFAASCLFEFIIMSIRFSQETRRWIGGILLLLLTISQGALVMQEPLIFGVPFFIIGCYRIINCMRYIFGRMHEDYLYRVVPRSSRYLITIQLLAGSLGLLVAHDHIELSGALVVVASMQLFATLVLVFSMRLNLKNSQVHTHEQLPDKELPSVSVLIPARNETSDLEACLKTLTASTYQKLEIIVLDDCSQDRTPEVIKQFAHDGVRFIRGSEPGEVWLPKNAAYNKLAGDASGEFLLFCGVDVRFEPNDIKTLVSFALEERLTMVSVLPARSIFSAGNSLAQQIRYLWELALPRFISNRPPVLSTLWLIQATALKKYGGMAAVRRNVVPEGFFARELAKKNMYRFLRSGEALGIASTKTPSEQRDTVIRVRYPQLHRRPEVVMSVALFELIMIIGPFILTIYSLYYNQWLIFAIALTASLGYLIVLVQMAHVMGRRSILSALNGIFAVFLDIWLVNRSMYLYEFGAVHWKERNVCLPVMHAIPSAPQLPRAKH